MNILLNWYLSIKKNIDIFIYHGKEESFFTILNLGLFERKEKGEVHGKQNSLT